jgi:hypothetical protein
MRRMGAKEKKQVGTFTLNFHWLIFSLAPSLEFAFGCGHGWILQLLLAVTAGNDVMGTWRLGRSFWTAQVISSAENQRPTLRARGPVIDALVR